MWFRALRQDVEDQTDFTQENEKASFDEVLKQIQYDILQLQVEMESLKRHNCTELDYDESATHISIRKQGSQNQEIDTNDISQPNVLAKQEHQQNEDIISINDIENIIQSLQSNQEFNNYLDDIVQEKVDTSFFDLVQGQAQTTQQTNLTPITRRSSLTGIASSSTRKGQFEEDFYSMMMLSIVRSRAWCFGIICFTMQMTLATIIIIEQTQKKFLETDMRVPIKVSILPRIAQMLAIILAIMTQNEFLMGIRTILMLPYKDKSRWGSIIDIDVDKCTKMRWFQHIFLPNCLKSVQGGMVLVASFIVIVQIDTTVDVLKDYSALFVVSSVDNLFFNFADMGYLGEKLSKKAEKMKKIKLDENERGVWKILAALLVTLITAFMTTYVYIMVGQANGKYVKQAYPICPVDEKIENEGETFLDIIGDKMCQFPQGQGPNIIECGWDGRDCEIMNERFPKCFVDDFSLLGDGNCETGIYNTEACGFDNGDCVSSNELIQMKYPNCNVENIGWVGDGNCNGGDYASDECENDGGDCTGCIVDNIDLVGDGNCDGSSYNNKVCGFDDGDCIEFNQQKSKKFPNCNVENIGWVGDGICNGGDYASDDCENDGDDCIDCIVDDMNLIGNSICNNGEFNNVDCSFDGGDCTEFNQQNQIKYPNCNVENIGWVGDGICNGKEFASTDCENDGGDCTGCIVDNIDLVGDGTCDGSLYNKIACGFDGGDCTEFNELNQIRYPNCNVENIGWVGDGICNGGKYASRKCKNDGGDCTGCIVDDINLIGNGSCDSREYNNVDCSFDGGDCAESNQQKRERYPNCNVENIGWIGDGICDGLEYGGKECGRDGGDCILCDMKNKDLIGDGFCDKENNVDGCSFDGNDCVPAMELIGDKHDGSWKWRGGVLGHDGKIYGIPFNANKILKIDPSSNATDPTPLVGDSFIIGLVNKWRGGVVGSNGIIYGVPYYAKSILTYNITSEKTKRIARRHPLLKYEEKFDGGVLANNGMIYFIPCDYKKVVKFDPLNLKNPLTEIGDDLGDEGDKMRGGVLGSDGNIYAIPYSGTRVLKINIGDDTTSFLGDEYQGASKWMNGVLAKDGNIYACPSFANQILQININSQTTNLVGPDLGDDDWKWSGFVEGEDGFLYGIPYASNDLLRFDPRSHTATLISLPEEWQENQRKIREDPKFKWVGGVRSENGFIYAFPYQADQVLSIAPLKIRP